MSHPSVRTHFELKLRTSGFDGSRAAGARLAAADADLFLSSKHAHWAASQRVVEERIALENRRMAKRLAQTQPYVGARSMMDASMLLHPAASAAAGPHSGSGASSRAASASRNRAPPRSAFSASYHPPRSGSAAEGAWEPATPGAESSMLRRPSPPPARSRPVSAYGSASHPYSAAEWGANHRSPSSNGSGVPSRAASAAPHRPNVHAQPRPASAALAMHAAAAASAAAADEAASPYTQASRSRKSSRRSSSSARRRSSSRPSHGGHSIGRGGSAHPRASPSAVAAWLAEDDDAESDAEDADFDLDQLRRSFEAELNPHIPATQQQQQQSATRQSRPPSGSMRPKPPPSASSAGSSRMPSASRSRPQHVQFPSHSPHPHLLQQNSLPLQHGDGAFVPVPPASPPGAPSLHPAQIAAHHHSHYSRPQHRHPSPPSSAPPTHQTQRHFDVDPATFFQRQHQALMEATLRQQQQQQREEQQFEQQFDPQSPYAASPPQQQQQMQLNGRSWTPSLDTPASPRSSAARASAAGMSPRFSNEPQQQQQQTSHQEEKENTHDPPSFSPSSSSEPPLIDDGSGIYTLAPSSSAAAARSAGSSSGSACYQPVLAMETFASGAQRYSARNAEFVMHPSRESRIASEIAAMQQERLEWTAERGHLGSFEGQPVFHAGLQTIQALSMQAQAQQQDGSNDGSAAGATPQPSSLSAHIKYASSSDPSSQQSMHEEKYSDPAFQSAAVHHSDRPQTPLSYDRSRRQVLVSEQGSAAPAAAAAPAARSSWRRHGRDASHSTPSSLPTASLFSSAAPTHPLTVALHAELRHHPLTLRRDFFSAAESDAAEAARARAQREQDEADDGDDTHLAPWMRAQANDAPPQAIPLMPHSAKQFSQGVARYTRDN